MFSIPDDLLELTEAEQAEALSLMPEHRVVAFNRHFPTWAHEGQLAPVRAPDGSDWRTWVLMAGRGFGKTRAGAEWVLDFLRQAQDERERGGGGIGGSAGPLRQPFGLPPPPEGECLGVSCPVAGPLRPTCGGPAVPAEHHRFPPEGEILDQRNSESPPLGEVASRSDDGGGAEPLRIALVAATVDEARRVMVEGQSGLLACAREDEIVQWAPSRRELVFKNGAVATLFSGASPEALRGPQHHIAWCDELAKWRHPDLTWDMLQLGLRCGERPRALVTTTPKGGCAALARILEATDTVETGGSTRRNPHLPAAFLEAVERAYGGTRMGREEIEGEFLRDVHGTLWPADLIERSRSAPPAPGELVRVVVGVDPPASASGTCGIVVCGLDRAGVGHVLADWSEGGLSPEGWAKRVATAAEAFGADRIVAENNQGGDMVKAVLRGCFDKLSMSGLRIQPATATKSKPARAEPIAGRFESGWAKFAGRFPALEAELAGLVPAGYEGPGKSPDRADAMVWALWALLIAPGAEPRVRVV